MNTKDIARKFREFATLLELQGANSFKIRALSNAARHLGKLNEPGTDFLTALDEKKVDGFGSELTAQVRELVETGSLAALEKIRSEFPPRILDLTKIPGLGPKKIKALYEQLGIKDLETLERACREQKVSSLRGFGVKTEATFLSALEELRSLRGLARIDTAESYLEALQSHLQRAIPEIRVEPAGEARRHLEVVKGLELVVANVTPETVTAALQSFPGISGLEQASAEKKTSLHFQLDEELEVSLRFSTDEQFGLSLLYATGSEQHLRQLEETAQAQGYRLTADGLDKGGKPYPLPAEDEIYRLLNLHPTPPELREGQSSFYKLTSEAPRLITNEDIKGVLHCHTTYSDGIHTLAELAYAVRDMGFQYLGITDHSQSASYAGGLRPDAIKRQHEEIDHLNEILAPFRIFKGIESDILPDGSLDYSEDILASFDFIIASVHSSLTLNAQQMTERLVAAVRNPYTTILGHPTGRLLLKRRPYAVDLEAVIAAAAETGTAIEVNCNPQRLELDWRYLEQAKKLNVPVPLCPDAHSIDQVQYLKYGVGIARKGGLTPEDVLCSWDVQKVSAYFKRKKS